jgi:hypothetical protein
LLIASFLPKLAKFLEGTLFRDKTQKGDKVLIKGDLSTDQQGNNWIEINDKNKGYIIKKLIV